MDILQGHEMRARGRRAFSRCRELPKHGGATRCTGYVADDFEAHGQRTVRSDFSMLRLLTSLPSTCGDGCKKSVAFLAPGAIKPWEERICGHRSVALVTKESKG
jgi:hypothetical protein